MKIQKLLHGNVGMSRNLGDEIDENFTDSDTQISSDIDVAMLKYLNFHNIEKPIDIKLGHLHGYVH